MVQGLLTYTQLAAILGMLNVQWPSILQGLLKGFSWLTHLAPKVAFLNASMHVLLAAVPAAHGSMQMLLAAVAAVGADLEVGRLKYKSAASKCLSE